MRRTNSKPPVYIPQKDGRLSGATRRIFRECDQGTSVLIELQYINKGMVEMTPLNEDITSEEGIRGIAELKEGRTAGPDQASGELVRCVPESVIPFSIGVLNKIFSKANFPEKWRESIVVLRHKKANSYYPDHCRGISPLSILRSYILF